MQTFNWRVTACAESWGRKKVADGACQKMNAQTLGRLAALGDLT